MTEQAENKAIADTYPHRLDDFIEQSQAPIAHLQALLTTLVPQKGNVASDCMHLTIMNALMTLEQSINSLSVEDMQPDPDWIQTNLTAGYLPIS